MRCTVSRTLSSAVVGCWLLCSGEGVTAFLSSRTCTRTRTGTSTTRPRTPTLKWNNGSHDQDQEHDQEDETVRVDSRRRDLFSSAIAASAVAASAAVASWSIIDMNHVQPAMAFTTTRLTAQWDASSGLNSNEKEFVAFDMSAYTAMRDDPSRTPLFKKSLFDRLNAGRGPGRGPESQTVLDLGTGPFALFAIMAAEMGAGKVYAIEANPEVANYARKFIQKQGFDDVITVLDGYSTDVTLPNNEKADIVVAEICGSISSEEGAYGTILDAHKRLIKDPTNAANWIPNRIQTWAAPASYTLHNLFVPPEFDWTKIANEPVRFNCRDLGLALLDEPQCVEDITFADIDILKSSTGSGSKGGTRSKTLSFKASGDRITDNTSVFFDEYRKGRLDKEKASSLATKAARSCSGIAFWPRIYLPGSSDSSEYVINSRTHPEGGPQKSHWQTVLPVMGATPVGGIQGGDVIEVTCNFDTPEGTNKSPKYTVVAEF
ncbi:arginine N-methyltransferase PRMT10 [Seminavis robusta]|uniref:Arginine N-methyltransferase PRMT10 n=1 Tax=Seminavis robusta TaxID=568900 RepID=A0A9N8DEU0_9STRA|nr:arginine N-methyltransferase PRMT10 [Seminavis robusta]|eukprot:Sro60_g034490.1 arginine N-methyltransferase PRMT10 (489) ;mRNA; f:11080-12546